MDPAPPNPDEFKQLQQLLALKRHEEPPPGYFDRLPGEIRARIAHAEAHPEPWWRRWLVAWDLSPALATGYAVVAVALVMGGVFVAGRNAGPGGTEVVTIGPAADPIPTNGVSASNAAPPGLFNTPSLPVQQVEFKK